MTLNSLRTAVSDTWLNPIHESRVHVLMETLLLERRGSAMRSWIGRSVLVTTGEAGKKGLLCRGRLESGTHNHCCWNDRPVEWDMNRFETICVSGCTDVRFDSGLWESDLWSRFFPWCRRWCRISCCFGLSLAAGHNNTNTHCYWKEKSAVDWKTPSQGMCFAATSRRSHLR